MKGTQLLNGLYTLEGEISRGGFAIIYLAQQRGESSRVAIKVGKTSDDPGYDKSIKEESRMIGSFDHKQIVKVLPIPREGKRAISIARGVELPGNPFFFVMEYLSGGTLEDYAKNVGPLPINEAAAIGVEVARALRHIHKEGYAHNDLKLENIIFRQPVEVGQPFDPVLIDFGIATRVNVQFGAGSLYIMSPEQVEVASGQKPPEFLDDMDKSKVDVWGLGIVLYRLLGGKLPFASRNQRTLTKSILQSRPMSLKKLGNLDPEIDALIIDGCLAKNSNHRMSMFDLGKELSRLGEGTVASKVKRSGWFR
jgi:serine/threonine protein kinase